MILRFVAYDLICFMRVFGFGKTWSIFVYNNVFNGTVFQGVKFGVDTIHSQVCSLRFDLFHAGVQLFLNLVYLCLQLHF